MMEEKRIYVVIAGSIQVPADGKGRVKTVVQPAGRQIAQACHVVSKLRDETTARNVGRVHNEVGCGAMAAVLTAPFYPMTTIILQARDSAEMQHVWFLLHKKKLNPVTFSDTNPEYGEGEWPTAVAAFATKKQTVGILDYLPMWGAQ